MISSRGRETLAPPFLPRFLFLASLHCDRREEDVKGHCRRTLQLFLRVPIPEPPLEAPPSPFFFVGARLDNAGIGVVFT